MEETAGATDVTGAEISLPNTTPGTESTPVDFQSIVPAEYAEAKWVQDIKDINTMFKMTDDLKREMGKRPAGIPQADEDWTEFNKLLGVPETIDGYNIPEVEGAQIDDATREYQTVMREAALKAGLRPEQWDALMAANDGFTNTNSIDPEAQMVEFDKLAEETFGDRVEDVKDVARGLLEKHCPEAFKDHVDNLGNKETIVLAAVLDAIQAEYISEDDIPRSKSASTQGAMTDAEKIKAGTELMKHPAYSDKSHPEHAAVYEKACRYFGTWQD